MVIIPESLVIPELVPSRTELRGEKAMAQLAADRCSVTKPASSTMRRC